ncbi:MAG: ECF transporter S component [Atopobiaceae bacterium]|nr:ECF transporter S component [Atopobiaceae bacterium]
MAGMQRNPASIATQRSGNPALELAALATPPLFMTVCGMLGISRFAISSLVVVIASVFLLLLGYDRSRPAAEEIVPITVLTAVAVAGRILFAAIPSVKPVSAIAIIAGCVFGRRSGFMVGALSGLASNFFFGQGPWTPWQMYAWGLVGYLAGVFMDAGVFRRRPFILAYGFLSGLIYGLVLNLWSILGFFHPNSFAQLVSLLAAAIPLDALHGVSTAVFLAILYYPWARKLERVKRKYGFGGSGTVEDWNQADQLPE